VILRATLDPSGEVTEISPVMPTESSEHYQSVVAAARKIRFAPAVDEYGRKTSQKVAIVYQY
jgi:TonB family protein